MLNKLIRLLARAPRLDDPGAAPLPPRARVRPRRRGRVRQLRHALAEPARTPAHARGRRHGPRLHGRRHAAPHPRAHPPAHAVRRGDRPRRRRKVRRLGARAAAHVARTTMKKKQQKVAAGKRLLCDFAYSTPYPDDAGDGRRFIHAYSAQAEERKYRFLEDARALLKAVGRELETYGFDRADVRVNPSGIAGSGDASADYRRPDSPRWLYVNVSETCVDILGEVPPIGTYPTTVAFTTRKDGICVM